MARFLIAVSSLANLSTFLSSVGRPPTSDIKADVVDVNAAPAIVVTADGSPVLVMSVLVVDRLVGEIFLLVNPEKLGGVSQT